MFGHDLSTRRVRDFRCLDLARDSREELVISVERRSRVVRREALGEVSSLIRPLSLKVLHFERLRVRRGVMSWEVEIALRV
jgi:hypothetical protein